MIKSYIRSMMIVAAVVSLAGCEAAFQDPMFAPNAGLLDSNAAAIAKTRSVSAANKAVGVIDAAGGTLSVGGHTLVVPAHAVSSPTIFSMHVVEANAIHVKLRANRVLDGAAVTQFPVAPVRLTLNAADVDALDLSGLKVVYLRDGTYTGAREVIASAVNQLARTVTADLTHFSDYAAILD